MSIGSVHQTTMDKISFDIPEVDMDDRGVSPVIGVILMVAITVILAAVIASFVLGFGDSVSQNVNAGTSINVNAANESATVTWVSSGTADKVWANTSTTQVELSNVGETAEFTGLSNGDTITVTAVKNGQRTVVAQRTIENI
jgi:flagellin-like protein